MKITIESTAQIVTANGTEMRVWRGTTERGVRITALIPRIAVEAGQDCSEFEKELQETAPPASIGEGVGPFSARMILWNIL